MFEITITKIPHKFCPGCGSPVSAVSLGGEHSRGGHDENVVFSCGARWLYQVCVDRLTNDSKCPRTPEGEREQLRGLFECIARDVRATFWDVSREAQRNALLEAVQSVASKYDIALRAPSRM